MRTKVLSLILFIFPVWGIAQNNAITIQVKNSSLEKIIEQIEQQTDYSIAYNPAEIDVSKKVSVSLTSANIHQVLTQMLKNTGYEYKIAGYHVIISQKKSDDKPSPAVFTQTVRGKIVDAQTSRPIEFASIVLENNPEKGATTDSLGNFRLSDIPVGRHDFRVTFVGYKPFLLKEILVTSSKEVILDIPLQENTVALKEVVITPQVNKQQPLNPMTTNGARMFSVEEANRYAGGGNDPARLVTAFAGVSGGLSSNGISIRGNSPMFLQWRLEGMESVNPTHFSDVTGIGGGIITALSSHVLGNSDFFMGAFPAEYGNALSGVFDIQLRNGNNQNYEHTVQIGTLGIEFASEGPFKKGGQASYLFNYRYSTMAIVGDLFPDLIGGAGNMRYYQDLTFKMNFPTKKAGTFSILGMWLKNHFMDHISKDVMEFDWDEIDEDIEGIGANSDFWQTKSVGGFGHRIFIGEKSYLKSALATNYIQNKAIGEHIYLRHNAEKFPAFNMKNTNWNVAFNTYLNTKFSAAHTNRTGINVTGLFFDMDYWMYSDRYNQWVYPPQGEMINFINNDGSSMALSAYSQSSFRLNSHLTANVGLHGMYFRLTERAVIEPRTGIRWQALPKHAFSLAYGKHSRRENTDYYFIKTPQTGNELVNRHLDFAKAHHFILSYDWSVSEHLRLKVEPYYQHLYNIPVEKGSHLSLINYYDFLQMLPKLVNEGKGKNYGIDVTLERYLNNGYYYLLTGTLFNSRYRDGNGVWRNTRLNRNYIANALGGKEWKMGRQKQNILSTSLRFTLQGGERYIPIDEAASINEQKHIYDYSRAYEPQYPASFIGHFNIGYKINRQKLSHEFVMQIINFTGSKEYGYGYNYFRYDPLWAETHIIPNIYYKIEF